jgi:hypothetical protein
MAWCVRLKGRRKGCFRLNSAHSASKLAHGRRPGKSANWWSTRQPRPAATSSGRCWSRLRPQLAAAANCVAVSWPCRREASRAPVVTDRKGVQGRGAGAGRSQRAAGRARVRGSGAQCAGAAAPDAPSPRDDRVLGVANPPKKAIADASAASREAGPPGRRASAAHGRSGRGSGSSGAKSPPCHRSTCGPSASCAPWLCVYKIFRTTFILQACTNQEKKHQKQCFSERKHAGGVKFFPKDFAGMGKGLMAEDGEDEGAKKAKAKMLKKATGGRGVAFTAAKEKGKGEADDDNDDDDEDSEDGDFEAGLIAAVFARIPHAA